MSWWDDLLGSTEDIPSVDLSDPALNYDYVPDIDLSDVDTSALLDTADWGDFGNEPFTDSLSGSSSDDYLSGLLGGTSSLDSYGIPASDGLDTLDSASSNVYDPTAAMSYDPVATESLWERLNLSPNMSIDPTTSDNSTAALLQQLTNNTPSVSLDSGTGLGSDPMNTANWGLYEPSNATDFSSKGMTDGGFDTGTFGRPDTGNGFVTMMAKLLAKPAIAGVAGKKSNLSNAIGALGGLASVYGALNPGKSGVAPSVSQNNTKKMSWNKSVANKARGGSIQAPMGALGLLRGSSPGQQDDVPINGSHGEYMMDADTVSALGDGNTDAGAKKLDQMRQNIRAHKRAAPKNKIPPKAKSPEAYLKGAK